MSRRQPPITFRLNSRNGKILFVFSLIFPLFLYGAVDVIENEDPEEGRPWYEPFAYPLKELCKPFGGTDYSDKRLAYWTLLAIFFTYIFLLPFIWTGDPRYAIFALMVAPLGVPLEDWGANIWGGHLAPQWEGPVETGFFLGLPSFYWPFLIWGFFGLIIFIFYETKLRPVYRRTGSKSRVV